MTAVFGTAAVVRGEEHAALFEIHGLKCRIIDCFTLSICLFKGLLLFISHHPDCIVSMKLSGFSIRFLIKIAYSHLKSIVCTAVTFLQTARHNHPAFQRLISWVPLFWLHIGHHPPPIPSSIDTEGIHNPHTGPHTLTGPANVPLPRHTPIDATQKQAKIINMSYPHGHTRLNAIKLHNWLPLHTVWTTTRDKTLGQRV